MNITIYITMPSKLSELIPNSINECKCYFTIQDMKQNNIIRCSYLAHLQRLLNDH